MRRMIKRYENRKMYDTREGSYVSLEDIKSMIIEGDVIQVIDNTNDEDITIQTLTQIVLDESKKGRSLFSSNLLHKAIRWGSHVLDDGFNQVKHRFDEMVPETIQEVMEKKRTKQEEFRLLKKRVVQLEEKLNELVKNSDSLEKEDFS